MWNWGSNLGIYASYVLHHLSDILVSMVILKSILLYNTENSIGNLVSSISDHIIEYEISTTSHTNT